MPRSRERPSHPHVLWIFGAGLVAALVAFRITPVAQSDFHIEAWRAYEPLMSGDARSFWANAPGYLGFIAIVGAPASLLGDVLGLGERGIFVLTAVPGAVVLTVLAVTLVRRARGASRTGSWLLLLVVAGSPMAWFALHYGHPEDLVAAGASVLAVGCAAERRPTVASLLLLGAVLAKQWAVLAILPAVIAAPEGRLRIVAIAGGGTAGALLLQVLTHPAASGSLTSSGVKFHTRQLWFPLGSTQVAGLTEVLPGERTGPAWLVRLTHPLIVAVAVPLSAAWYSRGLRRGSPAEDVFLLLALLFLLRCVLDPWNVPYYHLPFILALASWEVRRGHRRPVLSATATILVFATFLGWQTSHGWAAYAAYMGWALPALLAMWLRLFVFRATAVRTRYEFLQMTQPRAFSGCHQPLGPAGSSSGGELHLTKLS